MDAFTDVNNNVCVAHHGWVVDESDPAKFWMVDTFFDRSDSVARYP